MKNDRIPMIQIDDTIISIDCLSEKFCCDLDACKGECCIEGDAGAPVELDEVAELEEALPVVWPWLSASAQAVIDRQGVVYTDEDGDLVTSIVNGKDCVFTCYDERGYCYCALEKAYREGKSSFYKPLSCHLYPIRLKKIGDCVALNYHRWDVCKMAVMKGGAFESSGLPFPERTAHTPFRRRMVHGTGKCSEGIERTGLLGMKSDMQG